MVRKICLNKFKSVNEMLMTLVLLQTKELRDEKLFSIAEALMGKVKEHISAFS